MLTDKKRIPILQMILFGILPNFLKILSLRFRGKTIGKRVKIGYGSIVLADNLTIEDNVTIGFGSIIRGKDISIKRYGSIGSLVHIDVTSVRIGEDVTIRENVLIGGNPTHESAFEIGDRSHIGISCRINTSRRVSIGSETAIGGETKIFTHGSWQSMLDGYPCTYAPVTIGNNVWINWNVFILPDVTIGDGAMVTAGSIVTKSIGAKCLAGGNPATVKIPPGMYPREIDNSDKTEIIRYILTEFIKYLRSNSLEVQTGVSDSGEWIRIKNKPNTEYAVYYYVSQAGFSPGNIPHGAAVLLSEPVPDEIILKLLARKVMLLRLDTMTRYGTNTIGEETVVFLLKYGLKFKRYREGKQE